MASLVIEVSFEWEKEAGDCSQCYICDDKIFGNMYNLVLVICNKEEPTNINLCESCHDTLNRK